MNTSTVLAIVDSNSPNVTYQGDWTTGGINWEFSNTTMGSYTMGSTAIFKFQGTGVSVYGTQTAPDPNGNVAVTTYSIDGGPPVTYTAPTATKNYQQRFFRSEKLPDGNHTLLITVKSDCQPNYGVFIDYFLIQPSPPTLPYVDVIVDDKNPRVIYDGTWALRGSAAEFNLTVSTTNVPGSTATLFFNGTRVSVWGDFNPGLPGTIGPPTTSYTIDNGPSTTFTALNSTATTFRQPFFDSGVLPEGPHKLVVTALTNDTYGKYWLDYFLVRQSAGPPNPIQNSVASSSTSHNNTGPIVGGVIGALLFVAVLSLVGFFLRRRQRKKESTEKAEPHQGIIDHFPRPGGPPPPLGLVMPYHLAPTTETDSYHHTYISPGVTSKSTGSPYNTLPYSSKTTYLNHQNDVSSADYAAGTSSFSSPSSHTSSSPSLGGGVINRPLPPPPGKADRINPEQHGHHPDTAPPPYA